MENYIVTSFTTFVKHTCPPTLISEKLKLNTFARNCMKIKKCEKEVVKMVVEKFGELAMTEHLDMSKIKRYISRQKNID